MSNYRFILTLLFSIFTIWHGWSQLYMYIQLNDGDGIYYQLILEDNTALTFPIRIYSTFGQYITTLERAEDLHTSIRLGVYILRSEKASKKILLP